VALIAFVLAWFLREVPLRTEAGARTAAAERVRHSAQAADLGEGLGGAPTQRSSAEEVQRVLTRLSGPELRRFGYARLARAAGLDLSGGACWLLTRLAHQGATHGTVLAKQAGVTIEEGHPAAQQCVERGLVTRQDGVLALTPDGDRVAAKLFATQRARFEELLAGWSPDQRAELEPVLTKLSRAILGDESDRGQLSRD
jgi:DNA-binding MarR family transcriptional regulator